MENTVKKIEDKIKTLRKLNLTKTDILNTVSYVTNIPVHDIKLPAKIPGAKKKEIAFTRHLYCYIAANVIKEASLRNIGNEINRDHATVVYGRNNIDNFISIYDDEVIDSLNKITNIIIQQRIPMDYVI